MNILIQQLNKTIARNHMSAIQKNDLMPNLNAQIDKKIQHNKEEIYTMIEDDKITKNKENNIFTQNINKKLEKLISRNLQKINTMELLNILQIKLITKLIFSGLNYPLGNMTGR